MILMACFAFFAPLIAEEIDLSLYEAAIYSRNGEDGVLAKIFQLIPLSSKFFVDLGANDGVMGSKTCLLQKQGWEAVSIDRAFENGGIHLYKEFITAENINELLAKYHVPYGFDLLSIDLDYNDYHIWKAIDGKYKPSVVVIQYNGSYLSDEVAKYRPYFCGGNSNDFGASILALCHLGKAKGYSLVYAEKTGHNLFFIRDDILQSNDLAFKDVNDVEKLHRLPTYGK